MTSQQIEKIKEVLLQKREKLIGNAIHTLKDNMMMDIGDLPDEMDMASTEFLQSFQFRLRGRERTLLAKIDDALMRLDNGLYGKCDECGEKIHPKRIEARPEATMCIQCKEAQERDEHEFAGN